MLLSLLSTITARSNEASSLSKADVRVADIANCQSPVFVCTCVCVYTSQRMRLHVLILLKTHATRAKHPKESQKGSSLNAGHLSLPLPEEMTEGAVINDSPACDLQGSILPFPQAHVTPIFLFLLLK